MIPVYDDYVTTSQVAKRAKRSVQTIHRWIDNGWLNPVMRLPGEKGSYLFDPDDVEAAVERAQQRTGPSGT